MTKSIARAVAVAMAAGATFSTVGGAIAGPLPIDAAIKPAASNVLDVRYRNGAGLFAGFAIGMIGAAVASQYYYPGPYAGYYYGPAFGYPPPYYYGGYYRPYYYGPYYRPYGAYYGAPVIYHHRVIRHYRVRHR
jgi:hypothetical protein